MNMFIGYRYRKDFLVLDIYCYVNFQISFFVVVSYIPFILHPLSSIGNFDTWTVYCDDNVFIFKFPVFIIFFYLDIQLVYSPIYCSIIRDRWNFAFSMSLYNTFGLPIRKMKICLAS